MIDQNNNLSNITVSEDNVIRSTNRTNHHQVIIMQTDWQFIKNKINKIGFNSWHHSLSGMLIGTAIPYIINLFDNSKENDNYVAIILCLVFAWIFGNISKIPFIREKLNLSVKTENEIHIKDIQEKIKDIEDY